MTEPVPTIWSEIQSDPFDSHPSRSGYVIREEGDDELSRRVRVSLYDRDIIVIETWRDQWGLWVTGRRGETSAPWTSNPMIEAIWTVAQEDGTRSFLAAFIDALAWLREWDHGTPSETVVTGNTIDGNAT